MCAHNKPSYWIKSERYHDFVSWPGAMINSSSNYPCLEHIFMVPKVFEPLKYYCIYTEWEISGGNHDFPLSTLSSSHHSQSFELWILEEKIYLLSPKVFQFDVKNKVWRKQTGIISGTADTIQFQIPHKTPCGKRQLKISQHHRHPQRQLCGHRASLNVAKYFINQPKCSH